MTSSFWLMLAGIAAVNLMGAASPGPAFFVVSRTAVGQSRRAGLATAYGVVLATMIWSLKLTVLPDSSPRSCPPMAHFQSQAWYRSSESEGR